MVLKYGNLNLIEPSGPVKACNWIALTLPLPTGIPTTRSLVTIPTELSQLLQPAVFKFFTCLKEHRKFNEFM
jgi:hypothetical protein